jgi:WD40 repeat protein
MRNFFSIVEEENEFESDDDNSEDNNHVLSRKPFQFDILNSTDDIAENHKDDDSRSSSVSAASKESSVKSDEKGNVKMKVKEHRFYGIKGIFKQPKPSGLKVKGEKQGEYQNLSISQRLVFHQGPIWVMKFSNDGKYLATGGQDCKLVIWRVIGATDDFCEQYDTTFAEKIYQISTARKQEYLLAQSIANQSDNSNPGKSVDINTFEEETPCDLLEELPIRCYSDHVADIVDIAWSKLHFILTASIDKYVRLWHISR